MCSAQQTNSTGSSKRASPERDTETSTSPKKSKSVEETEAVPMDVSSTNSIVSVADNRKLWQATTKFCKHWESDTDAIGVRNIMAVFYMLAKIVAAGHAERPEFMDYFPKNEAWFTYVGRFLALYVKDVTSDGCPIRLSDTATKMAKEIGDVKVETLKSADGFDAMAELINADCNKATHEKIPKIVKGSDLEDPRLQLVALAAEFIKGKLSSPFNSDTEENAVFHGTEGGDQGTCHMMKQENVTRNAFTFKGNSFEAAVLSTTTSKGEESNIKLVAVLPNADEVTNATKQTSTKAMNAAVEEFAKSIDTLEALVNTPRDRALPDIQKKVEMPRIERKMAPFNLTSICGKELPETLMNDLSHITEINTEGEWKMDPMRVSKVVHATYLKVDETSFEAAAATAVIAFRSLSAEEPQPPNVLRFDRGFLFYLIDMNKETPHVLYHARIESETGLKDAPKAPKDDE